MSIGRMSRLYSGRDVMSRKNPAPALPNYPLHCGFAMNPQGGVDALWRDRLVIPHLIYALPRGCPFRVGCHATLQEPLLPFESLAGL